MHEYKAMVKNVNLIAHFYFIKQKRGSYNESIGR